MDIRPGTTIVGPEAKPITIETLIGRGGFGEVFSATTADGVRVAVKTVLTGALDADALRSFQNEAKHAVEISHPNVVRVLYVDNGETEPGRPPYMVMELVAGGTLADAIERRKASGKQFSNDELRAMYTQIAEGMAAVNAKLVHRDLKPANVLVAEEGVLKVGDFGLAKLADTATRSETFKGWGTRAYQAPEAFDGRPNTPAMDVYAGGVMFFELATFQRPIEPKAGEAGPLAWRNAHLLTPPKDIRKLRPDLSLDLVQLLVQMLQKDPAKRPPSFADVLAQLKKGGRTPGGPDVSALVSKATATLVQRTEAEARAREERERYAERRALLEMAFSEPMELLASVVEAYNSASSVGKLQMRSDDALAAEVLTRASGTRLVIAGQLIDDLDARPNGIVRAIAVVRLEPVPRLANERDMIRDTESFGSFDLVYRVQRADDRFGAWTQFRFEHNPLTGRSSYPRWFGLPLHELPHQLQVLQALGIYQHQARPLDDEWFKALLVRML